MAGGRDGNLARSRRAGAAAALGPTAATSPLGAIAWRAGCGRARASRRFNPSWRLRVGQRQRERSQDDSVGPRLPQWPGYQGCSPGDRANYLNSTPLGARPGYGEVIGVPEALWIWYCTDLAEANRVLTTPATTKAQIARKGEVYRQVLELLLAGRADPAFI
jgi:hypothetical protein